MTTTCKDCNLTYSYDPKYHKCADPSDKRRYGTGESWVDECMRKQRGGTQAPR